MMSNASREKGWTSYLGNGSGEDDYFVKLSNSLHELIHTRSLDHVDIVVLPLNLYGNSEVCLVQNLNRLLIVELGSRTDKRTLKLLWTKVSSRSSTRHFFPLKRSAIGGSNHCCFCSADSGAAVSSLGAGPGGGGGKTVFTAASSFRGTETALSSFSVAGKGSGSSIRTSPSPSF